MLIKDLNHLKQIFTVPVIFLILQTHFKENEFEVCTSIETFEHLPPERLDEYLQSIRKVTSEAVSYNNSSNVKLKKWVYDGGTHLYEYSDPKEFMDALNRNFPNDECWWDLGLVEVPLKSSDYLDIDRSMGFRYNK